MYSSWNLINRWIASAAKAGMVESKDKGSSARSFVPLDY